MTGGSSDATIVGAVRAVLFLWQNVLERHSRSFFSEGRMPERWLQNLFFLSSI
jgi:hypothetical protein